VDQIAVNPPIAVHKRMDVNKAEGRHGRRDDGVEMESSSTIEIHHSVDERSEIFRAGADVSEQHVSLLNQLFNLASRASPVANNSLREHHMRLIVARVLLV
jgi:hypothetical protein